MAKMDGEKRGDGGGLRQDLRAQRGKRGRMKKTPKKPAAKQKPAPAPAPKQKPVNKKFRNWYHVDVGLWHTGVHIFIGSRRDMVASMPEALQDYGYSFDKYKRECEAFRERNPDFWNAPDNGGDARCGAEDVFIRLSSLSCELSDLGLAWHECLHAANIILCNVKLTGNTNCEGLAYTQEYIAVRFLRQYVQREHPENFHGEPETGKEKTER